MMTRKKKNLISYVVFAVVCVAIIIAGICYKNYSSLIIQMEDMEGNFWPMVGTIPGKVYRTDHLHRFGYITLQEGTCFGQETPHIPAHEFHYFDSENCGEDYLALKPNSKRSWRCIHSDERRMVGFPHLYYYGCKAIPEAFLRAAARYGRKEIL